MASKEKGHGTNVEWRAKAYDDAPEWAATMERSRGGSGHSAAIEWRWELSLHHREKRRRVEAADAVTLAGLAGIPYWDARIGRTTTTANTNSGGGGAAAATTAGKGKARCTHQFAYLHSARPSCSRCYRPSSACLCSALRPDTLNNCHLRVCVLQHPKCQVSIGTSRILSLALKHCSVLVGENLSDETLAASMDSACEGAEHTYLLFPSADAVDAATVTESACPHPPKEDVDGAAGARCGDGGGARGCGAAAAAAAAACERACSDGVSGAGAGSEDGMYCECGCVKGHPYSVLIMLDGSWRQGKQLLRKNQVELAQYASKTLTLSNHPPSLFGRLKREPDETLLSTAEATAAVVSLIQHGPDHMMHYVPWILPPLEKLLDYQFKHIKENEQKKMAKQEAEAAEKAVASAVPET